MRANRMTAPLLLGAALLALGGRASGQDGPFGGDDRGNEPDAAPAASQDASTPDYLKALELQRKGKWGAAKRAFEKVIDKYPDSVHAADIEMRGGDNAFLGCTLIYEGGPPGRRIDVAVMGDGFTIESDSQQKQEDWAKLCLDVLFSEASFESYRDYFNYYFVRLCSLEEGVDPTDAEVAALEERNKKRRASRRKPTSFSTALECKAAGPQGQVLADRELVYKWLGYAAKEVPGCADDLLVIAFAQFGRLGMGGGGVANVGRPDKSVTVHEFGHSFVGLLDEYANNPNPPGRQIRVPNASTDPEDVPWKHWLDSKSKYAKDVGVFEGGATHKVGVWRPARTCAMNAAGATGFCPVCREAAVLRIYNIVNPIDAVSPVTTRELRIVAGDDTELVVTPMQPRDHDLEVEWYVEPMPVDAPGPDDIVQGGGTTFAPSYRGSWYTGGERDRQDRSILDFPPYGDLSKLGKADRKTKGEPRRHRFEAGKLPPGRYKVTARVRDTTDWVLVDTNHLLEERASWWVSVADARK